MQPYIESDLRLCVPVFETGSERQIVGWVCVTATFVALPFIFYGFQQIASTNRLRLPGSLSIADSSGSFNLETGCVMVSVFLCLHLSV